MNKLISGAAAAVLAAAGLAATTASAQAGGSSHGCPNGAVCIYPGTTLNATPTTFFYSYGPHNLVNQTGYHMVYNNQVDDHGKFPVVYFCDGYNGTKCDKGYLSGGDQRLNHRVTNLTPINSVLMPRPYK